MNECPIYLVNPETAVGGYNPPPTSPSSCTECCNCGYLQYEGLLPYLSEIRYYLKGPDQEAAGEFEFRLREQILEISRLFDMDAGVEPGHFSKAHYSTTRTYPTHGTNYIKIPEFVPGTLEIRTVGNFLVSPTSYGVQDGFVVYLPCSNGNACYPTCGCNDAKPRKVTKWPESCYQVTARWGKDCADVAVQRAIRDYLIETYRVQDPAETTMNGFPVSRTFKVPHSWTTYLKNFRDKRALYSQFAFA
jgi:hypothetical protein